MARASQTPQSPNMAAPPQALTLSAPNALGAGNGDIVPANSVLYIENGNASACVVTIKQPGFTGGANVGVVADPTVTVAAGAKALIGPFPTSFKQLPGTTDAGNVYLEYSLVASVTRALLVAPF